MGHKLHQTGIAQEAPGKTSQQSSTQAPLAHEDPSSPSSGKAESPHSTLPGEFSSGQDHVILVGQEVLHSFALSLALSFLLLGNMLCCHCEQLSVEVPLIGPSYILEQSFEVFGIVTLGVRWIFICGGLSGDW